MKNFWKYFKVFNLSIGAMYLLGFFTMCLVSCEAFGDLPSIEEIKNPKKVLASQVISSDFEILGKFFIQNRTELTYDEIPPYLIQALIATEDARFYEHAAIDVKGLATALFRTVFLGKPSGASTITQQLAKNMFHEDAGKVGLFSRLTQKMKEWSIAVELEKNFSKQEILALYLNTVPFVHNAYGIKEASRTYFNKDPKNLSIQDAAVIVGMLKGPAIFNPKSHPERALTRRNTVLDQMVKAGYLTEEKADSLKQTSIKIDFHMTAHNTGLAPYFREHVRAEVQKILNDIQKPDGSDYNLYTDGLRIFTTIDSRIQQDAEDAMKDHMAHLQQTFNAEWKGKEPWKVGAKPNPNLIKDALKELPSYKALQAEGLTSIEIEKELSQKIPMTVFTWKGTRDTMMSVIDSLKYYKKLLQVGVLAVDPTNGEIKAWVGGTDFTYFQMDHVRKSTKRQVGSTIKPLLYAAAIDGGKTPCYELPYVKPDIEGFEAWDPKASKDFVEGAMVMIKDGLRLSDNRVTANLIKEIGVSALINIAKALGIESVFEEVPSISLGVTDISLTEMVGAYTAFMNRGIYSKPYFIKRIEDKNGNVLYQETPQGKEALNERTAVLTNLMMQGVINNGTATRLRNSYGLKFEIAGKTGTTQSNTDGWFIAGTPQLLCGVWVGADDPSVTFASTATGQGASSALPIWAKLFSKAYNQKELRLNPKASFTMPQDSLYLIEFNCGVLPTPIDSLAISPEESDNIDDNQ